MNAQTKLLSAIIVATLILAASPGDASGFDAFKKARVARGATFSVQVTLSEAVMCKGTHQLSPRTPYRAEIVSMGDGSVKASFFDAAGQNAGEANGIIAVLNQGAASAPGAAHAEHKVQPADPGAATALNFTKLGFGPNSASNLKSEGQNRTLEIFSQDRTYGILIGLLVPAVQKVREAAVPPAQLAPVAAPGSSKIKN